uniref:C-type lectin domain-containing protein n=1 Tax=Cyanistes caeruleus TaxID=156563 RepID=A0A8C0Z862_CYACU
RRLGEGLTASSKQQDLSILKDDSLSSTPTYSFTACPPGLWCGELPQATVPLLSTVTLRVPWAGGWWQPLPAAPSHLLCFWCAGQCQFCPLGWLWDAGQCYYFSSAKKSWEQSREDCCSRGAQLVTIQANTTLVSAPTNTDAFHVGLKKDGFRSDWKWLDGTTPEG